MTVCDTDAIIVGAGPVGLFTVFELGLWDIRAHLVDILDKPGGQCAELYPEKPIYDIPALPRVTGAELTERLLEQIRPFAPTFHLNQSVERLQRLEDGRWSVETDTGTQLRAPTVFIASGGGRFTPKKPAIPGVDAYEGTGVQYRVLKAGELAGKKLVIAGGGDSALDWVLALQPIAGKVTLLHRRDEFRAAPHSVAAMRALQAAGAIEVVIGAPEGLEGPAPTLTGVRVQTAGGEVLLPADVLLPFYGLTMKPGPIADFGLEMREGLIVVDTEKFATSQPGVFAVGDINTYPGKLKLILSGFHEAALAARAAHDRVHPDRRFRFQYTTSSSELQRKLGAA